MSFFGNLFGKNKKARTLVCIEIGSDTVAGAYVYFSPGQAPTLLYTTSSDIKPLENESAAAATARTLGALGVELIQGAAPIAMRVAGSGTVSSILVSVKAPWQETTIRSEKIERTKPIPFTQQMLDMAIAKSAEAPQGRLLADEFVVGTILDGYTISNPVGKRASRINIMMLSSFIDEGLSIAVAEGLRRLFHTKEIRLVAATAIRYEAIRALFVHEKDYLIVDSTSNFLVIALMRRGLLSAVAHAEIGAEGEGWVKAFTSALETITKRYPLPRKVFLLASAEEQVRLKETIEKIPLSKLRLSDEPFTAVSVSVGQLTDLVKVADGVTPHLGLECMAVFWSRAGE